ncbi:short chain dehydrogenase [Demequina activiva]|uniref:Short chain dehydrogenase n=1 Tax=Demequina activiva TaxID=1582364 RepID=A0A919Q2Z8_9MICO|nr:short chain dehydrogenase [Demequina activiva]GIG53358.1 short chain dehydrogenase [Demequina activiva]
MRVLIIGSSGTLGTAARTALEGHEIVGASRSTDPAVDITDAESIAALFDAVGEVDSVVVAAGAVPFKRLPALAAADYTSAFTGKVLSQLNVVRLGTEHVRDGGSFTLTSGILSREPIAASAAASMANGALESYVLAAARELPRGIRINVVSPSVLASSTGHHAAFPGFTPVEDEAVGLAYLKAVAGNFTGRVLALD